MNAKEKERARKRTRKACTACRKAKTSCSDQRPCTRCVRLNKEDQCIDIPATSTMNDRDRETWVRVANFLRDPSSMPSHVAEALEQQVSLVLAEPAASPDPCDSSGSGHSLVLHKGTGGSGGGSDGEEEARRLREANQELQARLQVALAKLEQEQSVQHSFYFFGLTTGTETVAVSHWSFPSTQLMHYNAQFRELAQRPDSELSAPNFTCKRLFLEAFVQRCVKILMFLSHGTVSSMTVPQVWKNSRGEPVNVMSMVYIEVDRDSGHVAKIMMASTPAGEMSKHHTFNSAFIPADASFKNDSPANYGLLEECREGIMQQIYEARATPPASVSQGWGGSTMQASAIAAMSTATPEFSSPELYSSSSPSSAFSPESLEEPLFVEPTAFGHPQALPVQVASWSPQQEAQLAQPLHHHQQQQQQSPAFYNIGPLPEIAPATVQNMPQSRVTELLKSDLAQAPWAQSSPEHEAQVPSLPMPSFPMQTPALGMQEMSYYSGFGSLSLPFSDLDRLRPQA